MWTRETLAQNNQRSTFNKDANGLWRIYDNRTSLWLHKIKVTKFVPVLWVGTWLLEKKITSVYLFWKSWLMWELLTETKKKLREIEDSNSERTACSNILMCFYWGWLLSLTRKGSNSRCKWLRVTAAVTHSLPQTLIQSNGTFINKMVPPRTQKCSVFIKTVFTAVDSS